MIFNKMTVRILVRKDYGACFDFYTKKMGLIPVYGDRNGPYTSFTVKEGEASCFAIFEQKCMSLFRGYEIPSENPVSDTIAAIIPSNNFDEDYQRLKDAGVKFLGEPQFIEDWGMRCTYFRDPEGNLFELNGTDGNGV
ncbi:MAG: VOC family protein [Rickettsiales bacterium]|jgi:catechol 2,3-dioxygenase-like lactoylglutathione lyase family enzyme|nr:VOC family protein [Rickettsiales bacterium]